MVKSPLDVSEYLPVVTEGLQPRAARPARVIVVGAGMAGLVAAYELQRAGHDPLILEAQQRVGGRVLTLREPFAPGLYGEAGAMRIPRSHQLTLAYVERFGLELFPFTMDTLHAQCYLHGRRGRVSEADLNPELMGFEIAEEERGKSILQMWEEALEPFQRQIEEKGAQAWESITVTHDEYSLHEFLESQGWSEGAIELFGLVYNQEALMNSSFLEVLREELGHYYEDLLQIQGGMGRLPLAFYPHLRDRVRFGARMTALDQSDGGVTMHYRTSGGTFSLEGDYAILAVPFPVLRHVEALQPFSPGKQRAIRQLHYDASTKIFFQTRRRFWEEDEEIHGGATVTDLPIRNLYYPEHGRETGRGVLLASYTWSEDAHRWGSLSPRDRIEQALENVAQIHPQVLAEYEVGASKVWHNDQFAGGAFALFTPDQQTLLHEHVAEPEGRVHFAGEHTSLSHAWIQGAIESGLRAAQEVHERSQRGGAEG